MKRALVALLLVACTSAPVIEHVSAAPSAVTPAALELSFRPSRIFAGQEPSVEHLQGSLLMVIEEHEDHVRRLDELDIATMRVFRSLDFKDDFAAFEERGDSLYVVTVTIHPKRGATHNLHLVDRRTLEVVHRVESDGAIATLHSDDAFRPFMTVGSRGVRLTFKGVCPDSVSEDERGDGCVHYEAHRLVDLAEIKDRVIPIARRADTPPDDIGELPPESKRAAPQCKTHGLVVADSLWVGDNYFELAFGCCGSAPGGFFQCKAPK
jgi:hypothetical protein